ncbi:hypothetical protein KR032_009430, partial [Drosophila birchii]
IFPPAVLLLLAAFQLLATQVYAQAYPGYRNQDPTYQRQSNAGQNYQGRNYPDQNYQGPPQYNSNTRTYSTQDIQIGPKFGGGLDAQKPISDPQLEDIEMRQPAPAVPVASNYPAAPTNYMDRFSSKLFQKIAPANLRRNLVYSPVSVHALMALIYGASVGKTLVELKDVGEFYNQSVVANDFKDLITYNKDLGDAQLTIATKIYYNSQLGGVNPSFTPYAQHYFHAGIEALNMNQPKDSADRINDWVSDSTQGKIQNLITPSELDSRTQALLVNAIYFKGRWENEFATMDTLPYQFQNSDGTSSNVAMMYNEDVYGLADIPELDATVLELPYKNSGTSMLILLPKQPNGLANLERRLAGRELDLNKIAARVRRQTVTIRVPKFRVEFEQDMTVPLQELGVRQMFTSQSQINIMLEKRDKKVRVEKILQKAFIDVGEAGTEAAAASYAKFVPLSLPMKTPEFTADHPFVFAIRTASSVLFIGHVEHPTLMAP